MEQTALPSLRRKLRIFTVLENPSSSAGFEPSHLGPMAITITTIPPRATTSEQHYYKFDNTSNVHEDNFKINLKESKRVRMLNKFIWLCTASDGRLSMKTIP
jgi:hypothetical protein